MSKKREENIQKKEMMIASPIVVWQTKDKQKESKEKVIPFSSINHNFMETETTVGELTILTENQQSLTKMKIVSSGFGKVKAFMTLRCAA